LFGVCPDSLTSYGMPISIGISWLLVIPTQGKVGVRIVNNEEIAEMFTDIADMLNQSQENLFKIRAYDKVAGNIRELKEPVTKLAAEKRLREIPGVGDAIEKKLIEIAETGKLEYYEKLKASFYQEGPGQGGHDAG